MIKHEGDLVHVNAALSEVNYSRLWRHHGKNNTRDDCIPLWLQLDVFVLVFSTHRGMGGCGGVGFLLISDLDHVRQNTRGFL